MVFNSLTFLVFFAIVLILHNMPFAWRFKKLNLVIASCVFYAAWNPPFVLLLMLSAVVDFRLARWMQQATRPIARRLILTTSLSLSLGLLCLFKYTTFLLRTLAQLAGAIGIHYQPPAFDLILPLGISFYTFETISYLVDVYRRRIEACNSLLDYALFLSFFPHLVAGPIVRPADFLPQCRTPRNTTRQALSWGMVLLLIGLFEKVILADTFLGPVADRVYNQVHQAGCRDAWMGTLAFSGQIFFDFAGYSTCGIGVALCLGFVLRENFNCPYAAISPGEFWRRWHISLSTWLRDYLYIPLGGNQVSEGRVHVNLLTTMLLGGLWHGASWHYVAWGGIHGGYLVAERKLTAWFGAGVFEAGRFIQFSLALLTYALVCLAWTFFRAANLHDAISILRAMTNPHFHGELVGSVDALRVAGVIVLMLSVQWVLRDRPLASVASRLPSGILGLAMGMMIVCLVLAPGSNRAFIYFQF